MHPNGQEGLSMLIEDVNTQYVRTVTYLLDDVIEQDTSHLKNSTHSHQNNQFSMIAVHNNNTLLRPSQVLSEVQTETDKDDENCSNSPLNNRQLNRN